MDKCLKCQKVPADCKCVGGVKIIFVNRVPMSREEFQAHESKDNLTKKLEQTKFLAERVSELLSPVCSFCKGNGYLENFSDNHGTICILCNGNGKLNL